MDSRLFDGHGACRIASLTGGSSCVGFFFSLYFPISVGFSSGRVCACVRRSSGEEEMSRRGDFGE